MRVRWVRNERVSEVRAGARVGVRVRGVGVGTRFVGWG